MSYLYLIIGAIFVNNFILTQFLGICPFLGVSKKTDSALGIALQLLRVRLIVDKQTLHHRVLVRINGFQPVDDVGRLHVQLHSKVNHGARTVAFRSCGS